MCLLTSREWRYYPSRYSKMVDFIFMIGTSFAKGMGINVLNLIQIIHSHTHILYVLCSMNLPGNRAMFLFYLHMWALLLWTKQETRVPCPCLCPKTWKWLYKAAVWMVWTTVYMHPCFEALVMTTCVLECVISSFMTPWVVNQWIL